MKKESSIRHGIFCNSCESEFILDFYEVAVMGEPKHCPFCGEELDEDGMTVLESDAREEVNEGWEEIED